MGSGGGACARPHRRATRPWDSALVGVVAVSFPASGEWTLEDLFRLPDTGHRYEIVEGSLLVTPAAGVGNGDVVTQRAHLLRRTAPPSVAVYPRGPGVMIGRSAYEQDVLVVTAAAARSRPAAFSTSDVCLAVEVLSASSRTTDLVTKPAEYATGGIAHYWLVDRDVPSLTVLRLGPQGYEEVAVVRGAAAVPGAGTLRRNRRPGRARPAAAGRGIGAAPAETKVTATAGVPVGKRSSCGAGTTGRAARLLGWRATCPSRP
ncbi:MAG: Uma2 family endonuclease [Mycobacteriales bacterium]